MTHLSVDERLAAIEDDGPNRHPHLAVCERCRRAVAEDRALLDIAGAADVPEPSPLFWDHFSRRVAAGVQERSGPGCERRRMSWRVLAPLAAAVTLLVLTVAIGSRPASPPRVPPAIAGALAIEGAVADQAADDDGGWTLLGEIAGDFDVETLGDSLGHSLPGGADSAVWQLNEDERAELARLLQAEMPSVRSGS
jgi:hypothetical protein